MKYIILFAAILLGFSDISAQVNHGGRPYDWQKNQRLNEAPVILPAVDVAEAFREAEFLDQQKDIPYQFGINIPVDLDINNSGTWQTLPNGDRIWRLALKSAGALSLNFQFDQYHIPHGARIFVYSPDRDSFKGSFTQENTSSENSLGVGFIFDDELIVEYLEPASVAGEGYLHIDQVTHGFRPVMGGVDLDTENRGPFGNSSQCNVNVNCEPGLPYQKQKKSVAVIVVNGSGICSGALVNNTSEDGTPYFLTANHCFGGNLGNWVFYFNFETPNCDDPDSAAPTDYSVSGSSLVARNSLSDFMLLLLDETPPENFQVCYAGWDAHDLEATVNSAFGIHHPYGDVKKIAVDANAPTHSTVSFQSVNAEMWWVNNWEVGVTEPGSSGSPLFNQVGRIIGQLAGGSSGCNGNQNNGGYDIYGRFGVSWIGNETQAGSLAPHLDPENTGALEIGSYCPGSAAVENDLTLVSVQGIDYVMCGEDFVIPSVGIYNSGDNVVTECTVEYTINGVSSTYEWTGSLAVSGYDQILLEGISLQENENTFSVEIISVNNTTDANVAGNTFTKNFIAALAPTYVTISVTLDNYPDETSYNISQNNTVIYAMGNMGQYGPNNTITETYCLPEGCYLFSIFDQYGDGICCEYGEGSFEVMVNGQTVLQGGDFSSQQVGEFCTTVTDVSEKDAATARIYPNPAKGHLNILLEKPQQVNIRIFDQLGKVVRETTMHSATAELDISSLAAGLYVVEVTGTDLSMNQKLIVTK